MATTHARKRSRSRPQEVLAKTSWRPPPARHAGRARALRHRLRRLRQGPLQVDARRLLRQRPHPAHRRSRTTAPTSTPPSPRSARPSPTHDLRDVLVAIERTGRYHRLVQRAFAAAGFETRIVHPFATKQFRQPADPGNKTDDTDLAAIHRAAVNGFALLEADPRRSLDHLATRSSAIAATWSARRSALNCQIREHLEAALPGFAACFDKLWDSTVALASAPPLRLRRRHSAPPE